MSPAPSPSTVRNISQDTLDLSTGRKLRPGQQASLVLTASDTRLVDQRKLLLIVDGGPAPAQPDPHLVIVDVAGASDKQQPAWDAASKTFKLISPLGGSGVGGITDVPGLSSALALLQDKATAATDAELVAAVATLQAVHDATKQDAATAATDSELASAVSTINASLASKQDASLAATDAEVAAAVATLNTSIGAKADQAALTQEISDRAAGDAARQASADVVAEIVNQGHSYAAGSESKDIDNRFGALVAAEFGGREVNRGTPGAALASDESRQPGGFASAMQKAGPGQGPWLNTYGINTPAVFGWSTRSQNAERHAMRSVCVAERQREFRAYDHASHTATSGTWTPTADRTRGPGAGYVTASGGTASKTITLDADYDGAPIVPVFGTNSTLGAGSATIAGTAGAAATVDLNGTTQTVQELSNPITHYMAICQRLTALTPANAGQTITVQVPAGYAYFGYYVESLDPEPSYWADCIEPNPGNGFWANITRAICTSITQIYQQVAAEFTDGLVQVVPVNALMGGNADTENTAAAKNFAQPAKIHPSTGPGHRIIADAYIAAHRARTRPSSARRLRQRTSFTDLLIILDRPQAQLVPKATLAPIKWSRALRDTGATWDTSQPTRATLPADGIWEAAVVLGYDGSKTGGFRQAWARPNQTGTSTTGAVPGAQVPVASADFNAFVAPSTSLAPFTFEGRRGDWWEGLGWQQNGYGASTTLTAAMAAGDTTATVASTTGMAAGDVIRVDDEHMTIGAVASGTSLTGLTRAVATSGFTSNILGGGAPVAHSNGATATTGLFALDINASTARLVLRRIARL